MDTIFYWLHLVVIVFNLTGWIWTKTQKAHLILISITMFSWVILGIEHGLGYCFLTDWHWQVKYAAGYTDLPNSFITYIINYQLGFNISINLIDVSTAITFIIVAFLSFYVNRRWLKQLFSKIS